MKQLPQRDRFYARAFARFYDPVMASLERKVLGKRRRAILADLHGEVLEVGAGTGVNFAWYPTDARVLAIEPNPHMLKRAAKRLPDGGRITLKLAGIGDPGLERHIAPGSLDAVVCTLVLCTIPDPVTALSDFERWLKPGGRLRVIEHVRSRHPWRARLQDKVNPVWRSFADGCNLNRDTSTLIHEAGFEVDEAVPHHGPEGPKWINLGVQGILGCYRKPAQS